MTSDLDKIRAAASNGLKRLKIEALLGHALRGEEMVEYRKASALYDLAERKRRKERKYAHLSDNERKAQKTAAANEVGDLPEVENARRRRQCRGSLFKFMSVYCVGRGGFLKTAPSKRMKDIIDHLQSVVTSGGREHIRMARAHGKTSFIKAACVYGLAYGFRRFIVAVAARKGDATSMLEDIFNLCEVGETFAADFPEIAIPIRKLGGIMQRTQNQTYHGVRTQIGKTSERIILPTIDGSPSSGAVMVARGFKGASRGLVRGSMRPDLVLFDDLQDDKAARNPRIVQQYDEMIEKNFLGLGGHDRAISALMTSTPICPDDLSETYAAKKNWKTFTFPMMLKFPDCWKTDHDLWQKYFRIRQDAIQEGRSEYMEANQFYNEHRNEMDSGAEVLNPDFYDRETESSGVQHALNLFFASGEDAFEAEYQMRPVRKRDAFQLSVPLILSRIRKGSGMCHIPPETVFVACATDVNPSYGLSTAIVAFDRRQTGFIPWYCLHKTDIKVDMPEAERNARLYNALAAHGREIGALCKANGITIATWGVDAGFETDLVFRFVADAPNTCGARPTAMFGRAAKQYNPETRKRIQADRNGTVLCADPSTRRRWLLFDADRYREMAQKAWLGEVGAPGGLSLFDGGGYRHGEFASQVAGEVLEGKSMIAGRMIYLWRQTGKKHDFGDAVTMCYALAANFGISADVVSTQARTAPAAARKFPRKYVTTF